MDFSWAIPFPEVHKICTLFQLTEIANPIKFSYTSLSGCLQNGPQCGLAALAMCSGTPTQAKIEELLQSAINQNFSFNGEIFSVDDMAKLTKQYLNKAQVEIFNSDLNNMKIREFLLNKGLILVPYDSNKDNSPGLHRGHKAHWAVISGGIQTQNDFFVLARHGKAKNVAVWKLSNLSDSNSQLFEFSPDRKLQHVSYKLPKGGISGSLGLNNRCILIKFL